MNSMNPTHPNWTRIIRLERIGDRAWRLFCTTGNTKYQRLANNCRLAQNALR